MNPPILKDKFGTILDLVGDWVSTRCETRPNGMFLTRYLTFGDDKRTWQGHYAFYRDPHCHQPTFALNAKGLYVDRRKSSLIQGAVEYDFKLTSVKITPKDVTTVEFLNASIGCGKFGSWRRNVEQDVTSTNGCHSLDIKLPETEYELMKMDMSHGKLHLFIGQRPSDGASLRTIKRRPTSFQEPLAKCDTIAVFMSLNKINEPQKLVGGISGQCTHIGSAIIVVVSILHMLLFM